MFLKNTFRLLLWGLIALGSLQACSNGREGSLELHSEDDLAGLTLGCASGSYYELVYSKRDDLTLFVSNTEADCLQSLAQGFCDVMVSDEVILSDERLKQLGLRRAMLGEETFDVAYAIRKGNTEMARQLNEFLASAPLEAIIGHWLYGTPAVPLPEVQLAPDAVPLRCAVGMNMEPVSYLGDGGNWHGFEIEILQHFAAWAGRPIEFYFQDLLTAVMALNTGAIDFCSGSIFVTEERKKNMDFSMPYYACHPAFFVRDDSVLSRPDLGERLRMTLVTESRWKLIASGLLQTLKITLLSILLGTAFGVGVCACRRSRKRWLRRLSGLYGDFIDGIPTLVLLLIMFYVVFSGTGVDASLVAVVSFALCFASSSGSIFDAAISSVPYGQTEAGLSLGFTPLKTFMGIVFPQALKQGLPLYAGECVSLLKSTSIVGYIAIPDLTRASDLIRSRTFDALLPLILVTILYFVLAWIIRCLLNLALQRRK